MRELSECRIMVTPRSFARHDAALRVQLEAQVGAVFYNDRERPLKAEELIELIAECDGYIAGLDDITSQVIEAAKRLKVIARYGAGVDNIDLEAAARQGIIVCNTPGANADSVAELTIGFMLALCRQLCRASAATKVGDWPRIDGRMIGGKVIGLIGFGAIGSAVARMLKGFNCEVLAHDPTPDERRAGRLGVKLVSQSEVLRRSDIVSLHCPLTEDTRDMVDVEFLSKLKPGAFLINTARGELIDEPALAHSIQEGHVAGAALDAYRQQPPRFPHPMLDLPQVIAAPHMGSHTDGAVNAMGRQALQACLAVLRGEEPTSRVI